jgi:uncharacterized protein YkwD
VPVTHVAALVQPRRLVAVLTAFALLTGILVAVTATAAPASAASKATSYEAQFVAKINAARKAKKLRPLVVRADLVAVARKQASRMASQRKLHHNPKLAREVRNYRWVGENVGYGPSVARLHTAFMASPGHKRNILDKGYREVGIGIVIRGNTIWVAEVFRQPR